MALLRALLVYGLLAGFYLMALYVAVLCGIASIGLLVASIRRPSEFPIWSYPLAIATFCVLVSIVHGLVAARVPTQPLVPGAVKVSAKDQPRLWDTVTELAQRMGAPIPMELWLTAKPNASVRQETWPLRSRSGVRRMYIGVPLLVGLSADQLRAALCHELGHYAAMHTRVGSIAYRGSLALASVRDRVKRSHHRRMPVLYWYQWITLLYLWGYGRLYDRLTFTIRRRQEFEADCAAARIVGKDAMIDALRSGQALIAAWNDFSARFLNSKHNTDPVPENPFDAFAAMLADPHYQDVLTRYQQYPPDQPRFRLDTHPPLEQRLKALAGESSKPVDPGSPPAVEILESPQTLFLRLADANADNEARLSLCEWQDLVGRNQAAGALRDLKQALDQLHGTTLPQLNLDTTLKMLETGNSERLAEQLCHIRGEITATPEQRSALLCNTVYTLTGQALVLAGRAQWTVDWAGQGNTWLADNITPAAMRNVVRAAVLPSDDVCERRPEPAGSTAARELRRRLTRLGADVTRPVPTEPFDRASASQRTSGRFRTLGGLATAASILLGLAAGVSAVSAFGYSSLATARRGIRGSLFGPSEAAQASFDKATAFVQAMLPLEVATVLVTAALVGIWQYSYARNAETLRGPLGLGAGWAIVGWFAPLATLVPPLAQIERWAIFGSLIPFVAFAIPFVQLNQSARASDPELPANVNWRGARTPTILKVWTGSCILAAMYFFGSQGLASKPTAQDPSPQDNILADSSAGLGMLIFAVAGIVGIFMIRDLSQRQQRAIASAQRGPKTPDRVRSP